MRKRTKIEALPPALLKINNSGSHFTDASSKNKQKVNSPTLYFGVQTKKNVKRMREILGGEGSYSRKRLFQETFLFQEAHKRREVLSLEFFPLFRRRTLRGNGIGALNAISPTKPGSLGTGKDVLCRIISPSTIFDSRSRKPCPIQVPNGKSFGHPSLRLFPTAQKIISPKKAKNCIKST